MMHPIMPFLSEELWSRLPETEGYVMNAPFPNPSDFEADPVALAEVVTLAEMVALAEMVVLSRQSFAAKLPLASCGFHGAPP